MKSTAAVPFALVLALIAVPWLATAQETVPEAEIAALKAEVAARDQLIANQENLLNTYRCLFNTDTAAVAGGCDGTGPAVQVEPGPPPEAPTQADIDAREGLIAAQEGLLNTYRCRFNVDTEIVPNGCREGQPFVPADWFPDPTCRNDYRWWNGSWWTEHVENEYYQGRGRGSDPLASEFGSVLRWPNGTLVRVSQLPRPMAGVAPDCYSLWGRREDAPAGEFTAISAGSYHSCGIRADRTAVCWGWNGEGQTNAPSGEFTAISTGGIHSCGIRADRTAICWGTHVVGVGPTEGEAYAPDGEFTAITSSGAYEACGIRADRTVSCWGSVSDGSAYTPDGADGEFTAISTGYSHSCGIRANKTAVCWGPKYLGEADAPAGEFTAISTGFGHSCGIRANRTAVCWGSNTYGEADAPAGEFTAISTGTYLSCGIRADRTAVCWGSNTHGEADAPAGEFTAISTGDFHSCGITTDRIAVCWGPELPP